MTEQQFRVREEKKEAVRAAFARMREEGREVRCVGAIALLTAKQVQVQLALRWSLDGLVVKRSGKDEVLRPLLEVEVAKEVEARAAAGRGRHGPRVASGRRRRRRAAVAAVRAVTRARARASRTTTG